LLGDVQGNGKQGPTFYLLAKLLFFILIGAIVLSVAELLPFIRDSEHKWMKWVITLIFCILSVRYLDVNMVSAIILPYSAVAVALTAILPFVIYFFAVYNGTKSRTFRRLAWLFFAAIFTVLWTVRFDELGSSAWIYVATAGAALIMFVFDGTIHALWISMGGERVLSVGRQKNILHLRAELNDWGKEFAKGNISEKDYRDMVKDYNARIKRFQSEQ
jgi:drug/metabolite transporter (DMT)-like permease